MTRQYVAIKVTAGNRIRLTDEIMDAFGVEVGSQILFILK